VSKIGAVGLEEKAEAPRGASHRRHQSFRRRSERTFRRLVPPVKSRPLGPSRRPGKTEIPCMYERSSARTRT
jgi:hypothetical protein